MGKHPEDIGPLKRSGLNIALGLGELATGIDAEISSKDAYNVANSLKKIIDHVSKVEGDTAEAEFTEYAKAKLAVAVQQAAFEQNDGTITAEEQAKLDDLNKKIDQHYEKFSKYVTIEATDSSAVLKEGRDGLSSIDTTLEVTVVKPMEGAAREPINLRMQFNTATNDVSLDLGNKKDLEDPKIIEKLEYVLSELRADPNVDDGFPASQLIDLYNGKLETEYKGEPKVLKLIETMKATVEASLDNANGMHGGKEISVTELVHEAQVQEQQAKIENKADLTAEASNDQTWEQLKQSLPSLS